MALDLSTLTAEQQVAAIYIGYYERAADPEGEDFWEGAVNNPALSLADIATDFSTQPETLNVHPFFNDPTPDGANAFITELYLNLFNRLPDDDGLAFWSAALIAAINDEPESFEVGEIILLIIEGAQNSAEGNDLTTILNKIEVATSWTDAADAAGIDYPNDPAAQASAGSIIEGVTDEGSTVADAKSTIAEFFEGEGGTPGDVLSFTSGTDNLSGTENDDLFEGYLQQNPFAGGVSNGLSSADRADGGAGEDSLYAELVSEFVGGVSGTENIDIQPRLKNIEILEFEARDIAQNAPFNLDIQDLLDNRLNDLGFLDDLADGIITDALGFVADEVGVVPSEQLISLILDGWQRDVVVDAKNITGHDFLGSSFSDGDLMIENVTTLDSNGAVRNTGDITIGMDHTDNANSDGDASDLTVYFDEDYLISGQSAEGKIFYFLLDEDAELAGNPNRLNNIDVDGIRFTIDTGSGPVDVTIEDIAANVAGTHQGFVNALQPRLQELIADGTLPAGTTLTLDPTVTDTTFLDDGSESDLIPAIVLTSGDGSEVIATGFTRIEEPIGEYDVYGRFNSINEIEDDPVSVKIDLEKAGRGGEGGNLVIGGKDQTEAGDGIEVFHVNVKGDGPGAVVDQPSNIGTLTSTNNALREIYISTDAKDAVKDSVASLTIRDGFNELYDGDSLLGRESGDLQLVNADAFLGDLFLGTDQDIVNLDTLTAQGGGNVTFYGALDGRETNQAYSYTTGGGNDMIDVDIDGDALDYADSSLNILTGGGNDMVVIDGLDIYGSDDFGGFEPNERLNQAILDNVEIDTGTGDDMIMMAVGSRGNVNIKAGAGDDFVDTSGGDDDGTPDLAAWAFNYDYLRVDSNPGDLSPYDGNRGDLPGVPTTLAYVGGAKVTVTLSGAGTGPTEASDGGGVMALLTPGAVQGDDGYEATATIGSLINGNRYYGDQRDVNAAVIAAIEGDEVLSKLLSVSIEANNTLVIESTTGGDFDPDDIRIDIAQQNLTDWSDVEAEAQAVFSNSGISVTSVATANAPAPSDLTTSDNANDWYDGLSIRGDVNSVTIDGGDDNNQLDNGDESIRETDNVINGGNGNDLIVMSTDASFGGTGPNPFTILPGNSLQNWASNETIVMEGPGFGDDTVMNFTTGYREQQTREVLSNTATVSVVTQGADEVPEVPEVPAVAEVFVLELSDAETGEAGTITFGGDSITVVDTDTAASLVAKFLDAGFTPAGWTASAGPTGSTVTFTSTAPGVLADVTVADFGSTGTAGGVLVGTTTTVQGAALIPAVPAVAAVAETFTVTFGNSTADTSYTFDGETIPVFDGQLGTDIALAAANGVYDNWTASPAAGSSVTFTANTPGAVDPDVMNADFVGANIVTTVVDNDALTSGVDFLDFTDYLTSLYDSSAGPGDSSDSNILIPVELDYNETDQLGGTGDGAADVDVEANEVAVTRLATDTGEGETFAALNASVVQNLFNNNVDVDNEWGGLSEAEFNVALYSKVDQEQLIGDAKAIFMVENDNNLGEYKVFELTWDGDVTSASGATVAATQIGSLDFGTSLTDLDDVNLVGSDDYANLIQNGFGAA